MTKPLTLGLDGGRKVVLRHPLIVWPLRVLMYALIVPTMLVVFLVALVAVLVEVVTERWDA